MAQDIQKKMQALENELIKKDEQDKKSIDMSKEINPTKEEKTDINPSDSEQKKPIESENISEEKNVRIPENANRTSMKSEAEAEAEDEALGAAPGVSLIITYSAPLRESTRVRTVCGNCS